MRTVGDIGEDALIGIFARPGPVPPDVVVPNGDDAAAYRVPAGMVSCVTTDALVEGVHFELSTATPLEVGRKLMAVNLSDLAAMGAVPRYALLALCLPAKTPVEIATGIADGVHQRATIHGVTIIGGNVSRTQGPIVLTATLIGQVGEAHVLTRRGAQAGDLLWVTGEVGNARMGLEVLRRGVDRTRARRLLEALNDPEPRVPAGQALAASGAVHALCDVSDGLARDVRRLLGPLGLGSRIEAPWLPLSPLLVELSGELGLSATALALEGGEDYELLFAAPRAAEEAIRQACAGASTPVHVIGEVLGAPEHWVHTRDDRLVGLEGGFQHFGPGVS